MHSPAGELCFDGWTDDFHDIEPSVGKSLSPCGDTGGADQHVQARKMSVTELEIAAAKIQRCKGHADFHARDFRDSLKKGNSLMNQIDKRGAIAVRDTHSVGIDCLPMFGTGTHATCIVFAIL